MNSVRGREDLDDRGSNLWKGQVLLLQGKTHEPFGTPNVQATAKSVLRRIQRETGLDMSTLERRLTAMRP